MRSLLFALLLATTSPGVSRAEVTLEEVERAYLRVVDRVRPSAVAVTWIPREQEGPFKGVLPAARPIAISGVAFDAQGDCVTLSRFIGDAREIEVTFADGSRRPARLVGRDPETGLAVVRVADATGIVPATFASRAARAGAICVVVGNPCGLNGSIAYGNVSGTDRVTPRGSSIGLLQITAPVNPGDQGAPVADARGEIIGIVSSTYRRAGAITQQDLVEALRGNLRLFRRLLERERGDEARPDSPAVGGGPGGEKDDRDDASPLGSAGSGDLSGDFVATQGISFAIPVEAVRGLAERIVRGEPIKRPFLGVQVTNLDDALRHTLGDAGGVLVTHVRDGSPAAKCGLQERDIILSFGGVSVGEVFELRRAVAAAKTGVPLKAMVVRAGDRKEIDVILEDREVR